MPAPQVVVVQAHSSWSTTPPRRVYCGGVQEAEAPPPFPGAGKGRAVAWSSCFTCGGVSRGSTDRASATTPATRGAEKLVPTEVLKLSVYVERTGPISPSSVAVRIG